MNRTTYFGEGLFESIRWIGESPKLELHYRRLKSSAEFFGIPCPSYEEFLEFIKTAVGGDSNLYVKFLLMSSGSGYYADYPEDYEVRVLVKALPKPPAEVSLLLSDLRRHSLNPLFRHKTTSYMFSVLVKREANARGFFDGVVLNEREEVTECSASNLILLKGDRLFTPTRESGLLWGTTLDYMLASGVNLEERVIKLKDLEEADTLFITNSLIGVVPVKRFGDTEYITDEDVLEELSRAAGVV